jgi:Gas vesicle synthesis protein GvpO
VASRTNGRSKDRVNKLELVKDAAVQLTTLTGRRPEKVLGFEKGDDDNWRISFELLELERMPKSTDLLGCYVVEVDDDGDLVGYERVHRYQRGQPDRDG